MRNGNFRMNYCFKIFRFLGWLDIHCGHCEVLLFEKGNVTECSSHSTVVKFFPSFFITDIITARFLRAVLPGKL